MMRATLNFWWQEKVVKVGTLGILYANELSAN